MPVVIETKIRDCTAYIVIDSFYGGSSVGGLRIASDITLDEVKALAREMTYKYTFFGLKRGGAKGGLKVPESIPKEQIISIMKEYGLQIAPLIKKGLYYPWTDMACGREEITALHQGAGIRMVGYTDSAYYTAMTVGISVEVCKEYLYGRNRCVRIAIEGFGRVSSYLAQRLDPKEYKIVAISTIDGARHEEKGFPLDELIQTRKGYGDALVNKINIGRKIQKEELFRVDSEILIPSARTWTVDSANAGDITAKVIVPAANAPYSEGAVDILTRRGIMSLPGFVTNAGGVIGSSFKDRGMDDETIEATMRKYYRPLVKSLIEKSEREGASPAAAAEKHVIELRERDATDGVSTRSVLSMIKRMVRDNFIIRKRRNAVYIDNVLRHMSSVSKYFEK